VFALFGLNITASFKDVILQVEAMSGRCALLHFSFLNCLFCLIRKSKPHTLLVGMQTSTTTLEKNWRLLKKLNIDLPYDPAVPLLGIYPKECNTGYSRGTCTPMFIEAQFTTANLWKQPRCPASDEWIKKIWYLYTK
jgi:hypothetical protein